MILPPTALEQMKVTSQKEFVNKKSDEECGIFSADEFSHTSDQLMESVNDPVKDATKQPSLVWKKLEPTI